MASNPAAAIEQDPNTERIVIDADYDFPDVATLSTRSATPDTETLIESGPAEEVPETLQPEVGKTNIVEYRNAVSIITAHSRNCSNTTSVSKPKKVGSKIQAVANFSRSKACKGNMSASGTSSYKWLGIWSDAKVVKSNSPVKPGKRHTLGWSVKCKKSKQKTWANTASMDGEREPASARSPAVKLKCSV